MVGFPEWSEHLEMNGMFFWAVCFSSGEEETPIPSQAYL